jgi:beta-1,4-mannosyl-glycoprotein beta-1,4-N-acetylglucosaminyltransferase
MKLIDAFIFYNEEKMLNYRLNYYKNIVDYFIIVEATKTFSGLDKPLYFNRIKDKYKDFNIIHYIVDEFPPNLDAWGREHYQRECIHKALLKVPDLKDEDWIHIADVDEISNRDKLETVLIDNYYNNHERVGYTLHFDNYYYNLTSKLDVPCFVTKLIRYGELKDKVIKDVRFSTNYPLLYQFGWHLSYFFTPDLIKSKIQAFAHQEYNSDDFTNKEHVEDCIKSGKSLFHKDPTRTEKIYHIPLELNDNLPQDYHLLL